MGLENSSGKAKRIKPDIRMKTPAEPLPIYTADLETDPFEHGLLVEAFVCGFYDGSSFVYFWGKNWLAKFLSHLESIPPGIIYIHNGGKFDFFHMLKLFDGKMMLINRRIVRAESPTGHEFRDSLAILPFSLSTYKKDDIDYNKLKKEVRNKHKPEIIKYLKGDCVYLWELCSEFFIEFGDNITIGGTAMRELQKVHEFTSLTEPEDSDIRSKYYYGGRVQCFRKGIITAPLKIYDVNSMYPFSMKNFKHPIGRQTASSNRIGRNTCFISVLGKNYGAFPVREKSGGIRFDVDSGVFHVTRHEFDAAVRYGLFEPQRIVECRNFENRSSFSEFVDKFYNLRNAAKDNNDPIRTLFYKFILNSAYGKFAQNPKNYRDYKITSNGETIENWRPDYIAESSHIIWSTPSKVFTRYNVATACSITGAARSILLEALANAKGAVYCDTDSIICEEITNVPLHDKNLGSWKFEGDGTKAAIAGKKLYGIFDDNPERMKKRNDDERKAAKKENRKVKLPTVYKGYGHCIKQANKGVRITADEIVRCCHGEVIQTHRMAPSYKLDGNHQFVSRKVKML